MESTTQWCKKRRTQNLPDGKKRNTSSSDSFDRISALPDAVICHILSFLPTKISVSTSFLARRWRTLWAHVPNLDFESTNRCLGTSISNVIGRVMLLHKLQSINAFRLSYTDYCENYAFETWIAAVIARNVRIIDIGLNYQLVVPPCLFTCKTLVDLSLHCCCVIISGIIFLPCLKKLHLSRVNYDDGENLPKLFPGCPVLEELVMRRRKGDGLVCLNISSPSLKSLTLNFPFDHPGYYNHDCKVEISAPAATYLQLTDSMSTPISSQMLTSLTEAEVSFDYNKYSNDDEDDYFQSVYKFLDSLCNAKSLKLSSDIELEHDNAFDDQSGSIRKFHNLTRLELNADWLFVTIFLESADNLEVLIIRESYGCYDQGPEYLRLWTEPEQVPACLSSHLKIVRIDNFMFKEHEFELIRYLLMNAKVLDRMQIYSSSYYWFGFKPKFEALQRISLFKRVSEACELAFY